MQKTDTLVTNISQAEIESLEKLYSFEERQEVLNFIDQNPFLVPLLLEAPAKIGEYFQNAELRLEVEVDPEEANFVELFLLIVTDLEPEEAVDKLDELDENWWLDSGIRGQNKLEIDITFS